MCMSCRTGPEGPYRRQAATRGLPIRRWSAYWCRDGWRACGPAGGAGCGGRGDQPRGGGCGWRARAGGQVHGDLAAEPVPGGQVRVVPAAEAAGVIPVRAAAARRTGPGCHLAGRSPAARRGPSPGPPRGPAGAAARWPYRAAQVTTAARRSCSGAPRCRSRSAHRAGAGRARHVTSAAAGPRRPPPCPHG